MNLTDPSSFNNVWGCFNNPLSACIGNGSNGNGSNGGVEGNNNNNNNNKTAFGISRRRDKQEDDLEDSALNKLLNEKLTQMSLEERSSGVDEIHGVSEVKETPEMIENGIKEMNQTLNRLVLDDGGGGGGGFHNNNSNNGEQHPHKSGKQLKLSSLTYHYRLALKQSTDYVELLKVSCLRAERYDGSKAALRLVRFFERKASLFGEESLARDLEFERDLGDDEQEAMKRGLYQVLPHRDRSGRAVLFCYGKIFSSHYSSDTVMRCLMYICTSSALQDLETQKRGIVVIGYVLGQQYSAPGRPAALVQLWRAVPLFISAYHGCVNTPIMIMPIYILCKYLENYSISRLKIHTGTPVECIYNLMTFGIPKDVIPVNVTDGSVDLTFQHIMLDTLKHVEKTKREKSQQQQFLHHISTTTTSSVEKSQKQPQQQQQGLFPTSTLTSTITASSVTTTMMPKTTTTTTTTATSSNTDTTTTDSSGSDSETVDNMSLEETEEPKQRQQQKRKDEHDNNDLCQQQQQQSVSGVLPPRSRRSSKKTKARPHHHVEQQQNTVIPPEERELILVPGPMDIIMGKGRRPKSRPGSLQLHNLMLHYREQYDKSSKSEKTDLANVILSEVKEAGCRFLTILESSTSSTSASSSPSSSSLDTMDKKKKNNDKMDDNNNNNNNKSTIYVECDDATARLRIAHGFRNIRSRAQKRQQKRQKSSSDEDNESNE